MTRNTIALHSLYTLSVIILDVIMLNVIIMSGIPTGQSYK